MDEILTTNALVKKYGSHIALKDISIHVPPGCIYALAGRNGAGKTTLIRLICGLQKPDSGSYTLFGKSNTDKEIQKVRKRMGVIIERPAIYPSMTAAENLMVQYRILGMPSFDDIPALLSLVGLKDTGKQAAGTFSLGMKQRLGIAIALAGHPDFLVLDEPANGLDPQGIIELRELILRLNRDRQITMFISSHILDELSRIATHYCFLDQGYLLREITAAELNAACRKCICLSVNSTLPLCAVLDEKGLKYRILSDTLAEIYSPVIITQLVQALAAAGCTVLSIHEREEGLENYYLNLVLPPDRN